MRQEETTKTDARGNAWLIAALVLCNFTISFLRQAYDVPLPLSLMIVGSVVFLSLYWRHPDQPISFWRYVLGMEYMIIGLALAFWYIPALLSQKAPLWIAYALPAFSYLVMWYFVLKEVRNGDVRMTSFRKWLLGSVVATSLITLLRLL